MTDQEKTAQEDFDELKRRAEAVLDALPVLLGAKEGNVTDAFVAVGRLSKYLKEGDTK